MMRVTLVSTPSLVSSQFTYYILSQKLNPNSCLLYFSSVHPTAAAPSSLYCRRVRCLSVTLASPSHCHTRVAVALSFNVTKLHDEKTGNTQRRLANGISVNYEISKTEIQSGVMWLIVGGGRAAESSESRGFVILGVRTLSEGGRVGNFSREQVNI
ncbi:Putative zinc protease pqqL [Arachis hypogaea]|nr:Putative zinc protease pqqL [Arachis hypogaea]